MKQTFYLLERKYEDSDHNSVVPRLCTSIIKQGATFSSLMTRRAELAAANKGAIGILQPFWAPWVQALAGLGHTVRCKSQLGCFDWLHTTKIPMPRRES
jgi:hypothetical protein